MKEKITFKRKKAVFLTVEFNGTTEEYALAWLKLTNNAREYSNMIWKISNCSSNEVFVICNPKSVEAVKDFCTGILTFYDEEKGTTHQIGVVTGEREIEVGVPVYEWESSYSCDDPKWEEEFDKYLQHWLITECE